MAGAEDRLRGLDADGLEEVLAALPDVEVVAAALQMGPQAGEAGNDVPHGQVRHTAARRGDGVIQPRLGGSSVVPVLLIRGSGAEEEVSVDSGGSPAHPLPMAPGS